MILKSNYLLSQLVQGKQRRAGNEFQARYLMKCYNELFV